MSDHLGIADSGASTRCLRVADAIATVAIGLTTEAASKRRSRAKALIEALIGKGFLETGSDEVGDGWVWQL